MKVMEEKAYTAFSEMGFCETGFCKMGRHRSVKWDLLWRFESVWIPQ